VKVISTVLRGKETERFTTYPTIDIAAYHEN